MSKLIRNDKIIGGAASNARNIAFNKVNTKVVTKSSVQGVIEELDDAIDSLNNDLANSRTLLWTNPNPNADMREATLELSNSDYDHLLFKIKHQTGSNRMYYEMIDKGDELYLNRVQPSTGGSAYLFARAITRNDDTHYTVLQCVSQGNNATQGAYNNTLLIPIAIYGVKDF